MTQRDTILPLCRIVNIANNTGRTVKLANTAIVIDSVTVTGASGFPMGNTRLTVSSVGVASDTVTSALLDVVGIRSDAGVAVQEVRVANKGLYKSPAISALSISGLDAIYPNGLALLGVSGTFTINPTPSLAQVPYVTVTDLSGALGWFRVSPGSGADLYASSSPAIGAMETNVSGNPGVVGVAGSTVVLTLQPSQKISTVEIHNNTGITGDFAINYGVIKDANPLRDQETPDVR